MRFIILLLLMMQVFAASQDPFTKPAKKLLINQRYQYLGFMQLGDKKWALIKPAALDIQRIGIGKTAGLGKVYLINATKVCLTKKDHKYCLYSSAQAGIWR